MPNIRQTKLVVQGNSIHCASCEKRIKNALNIRPGVFAVESSSSTQEVVVSHDSEQIALEEILELLEKIGFPASPVSEGI
jgi:Cu+-exporting ATPase